MISNGVVETDKRQQIESGYVFDGVFVTDAFGQFFVGAYFVAQYADAADEVAMGHFEGSAADGISGIQQGAVHQDDAGGNKHFVAVGMRAAIHAGSIVHDDAAHHGAFHRGGIGGKLATVGGQQLVYTLSDDARLEGYLFMVGRYAVFSQFLPATMRMESLMAWPDKLVPAARKVTGSLWRLASFNSCETSSSSFERITIWGIRR